MSIKESTRQKLRDAAIKNGFGGVHYYYKICDNCYKNYKAKAPNQLLCYECKNIGKLGKCSYCKSDFNSKCNGKYCNKCVKNRVWMIGVDYSERGKKIQKTKKVWLQSNEAKKFYRDLGKYNSKKMKSFNKTKQGKINIELSSKFMSKLMKERISNGTFTPPITNSFTHWNAKIGNKKFRSSWEACFWKSNQHLKYESKECRTQKINNTVYIGDFFDEKAKILFEIKPRKFFLKQSKKIDALIEHCKENGYKFRWINENNILNWITPKLFIKKEDLKQLKMLYKGIGYNEKNQNKIN